MKFAVFAAFVSTLLPGILYASDIKGGQIFQRECMVCHGRDGSGQTDLGQKLRPLPAADLRPKILSRREIIHVIRFGRKKTGMHGHSARLTDEEINHLVDYILTLPYRAKPDEGRKVFQKNCARCHGQDGTGNQKPHIPNLVLSELSDIQMAEAIRQGHENTIMGSFKGDLSNGDIGNILAWLRLKRYGLDSFLDSD